jgi:hypothetical protein
MLNTMKQGSYWLIGLVIITVAVTAAMLLKPKPFLPPKIKSKTTSVVFVSKAPNILNNQNSVKYDDRIKLLSYQATLFGVHSVISEQPTPDSFTDIPQVYQKVLNSWKEYKNFSAPLGTVYLTRPGDQGGKQVAVLNAKGTLMFVKPDKDLTEDQWRQYFKSIEVIN